MLPIWPCSSLRAWSEQREGAPRHLYKHQDVKLDWILCQTADLLLLLCSVAVGEALETILHSALGAFVLGLHRLLAALQQ